MKELRGKFKQLSKESKKALKKALEFLIKYRYVFFMCLPFIAMDLFTRILGSSIGFYKLYRLGPNLFTISWIILFVGVSLLLKNKIGKWVYLSLNIIFIIFYLINNVYFSMASNFFGFHLIDSASEGAPYILDAIKNCNVMVYIFLVAIILLTYFGFRNIPNNKAKFNYKKLFIIIGFSLLFHTVALLSLGKANSDLVWSTWKNPKNIYNQYNDANKSMRVSGLFEYTLRNFYVTFLKPQKENEDELAFLQTEYSKELQKDKNKYTGIFEGKNLIFLQLEGIDNWLITKNDTPTLYKMMNNSINFKDHYSFFNGGGSTFNSEFAVNTGFIVPFSFNQNAYAFNNNSFPYSMPKLFKERNYSVNAFHMNKGEYYSRSINYANWGYENYYGLIDMYKYENYEYQLDRELILNEEYSNLMFPTDKSFVDYIITYSTHLPFSNTKGVCKQLYNLDNTPLETESSMEITSSSVIEIVEMSEEECARRQAKETDYMVELMLDKLNTLGLIDNTVIVVFTDHYLYTLEDQTILDKYKETSNNLINKTPFFIWNNGKTKATIKKTTSQLNILPTTLNLFGFDYNPDHYIGSDALSNNYSGIVFFSDYSWYDGNVYVEGGEVTNNKRTSEETLETNNYLINYLAKKNDLTLKYNYFKKIK